MLKFKNKQTRTILFAVILILSIFGIINFEEFEGNTRDLKLTDDSTFEVVDIVDGDTFKFTNGNTVETARLVGVDTPEKNHPQKDVECFAIEASEELERLLEGEYVYLEYDTEQNETDRYGRLLVYAWINKRNGTFINEYLVENGFAKVYRSAPSRYLSEFEELEKTAKNQERGLWGEICK